MNSTFSTDYLRSRSQSKFDDFPSLSPPRRSPIVSSTLYSTPSLGAAAYRSHSLDHRRFPAFGTAEGGAAGGRAIYSSSIGTQRTGGGYKGHQSNYTGELFDTGGATTRSGIADAPAPAANYYSRSGSSAERSGVTVVPIRREATMPARQYHSEWKSEWKSGPGEIGARNGTTAMANQLEQEDGQEQVYYDRSARFNTQRRAWASPQQNRSGQRMEMIEGPRTGGYYPDSTADYATFRRSNKADAAAQQQHQEQFQRSRHQQHHREHREWHSGGGGGYRSSGAEHYGTLGARGERRQAAARNAASYQQQQQYREAEGGYGYGGGGGAHSRAHHQHHQQQYANGWTSAGGGYGRQQRHREKRGGWFGRSKSKSSGSGAAKWSSLQQHYQQRGYGKDEAGGPKRYRKIRLCCFNLIWPPWAVEPSGPPRRLYAGDREKGGGLPSPSPIGHRPSYGPPPSDASPRLIRAEVPPSSSQYPQPLANDVAPRAMAGEYVPQQPSTAAGGGMDYHRRGSMGGPAGAEGIGGIPPPPSYGQQQQQHFQQGQATAGGDGRWQRRV